MKLPNQAYLDLSLGKDGHGLSSAEQESVDEGNSTSSANSTPQMTPTNSLSRTLPKKKMDSVFYGCAVVLASVALGCDVRELNRWQVPDEVLPKEEKKKRDGLFHRASKFRRSASPVRVQFKKEETHTPSLCPSTNTVNLLSLSSVSTKCLLQPDHDDVHGCTLPNDKDVPVKCFLSENPVSKREQTAKVISATDFYLPSPSLPPKQGSPFIANAFSSKVKGLGHRRTMSDGNPRCTISE